MVHPQSCASGKCALKIVKAETFRPAFLVVSHDQVLGLLHHGGFFGLQFTLLPALRLFSLLLLARTLLLPLCKGGSRASSHDHSFVGKKFLRGRPARPHHVTIVPHSGVEFLVLRETTSLFYIS